MLLVCGVQPQAVKLKVEDQLHSNGATKGIFYAYDVMSIGILPLFLDAILNIYIAAT